MDHDINKRQTRLIIKVHNWEFPGNDHNQLSLFGKKVFFFWERFWQSFLEQLITVSSLYKTAHEILYSQVWKSTHTSKTLYLSSRSPYQKEDFLENEAFDCLTKFLKTSVFNKKCWFIYREKVWQKFTLEYLQGQIHLHVDKPLVTLVKTIYIMSCILKWQKCSARK